MNLLKITIIGVGQMGYNHLRVLSNLKGVYVNNIYDKNTNRLKKVAKKYKVNYSTDIRKSIIKSNTTSLLKGHIILSVAYIVP